MFEEKTLEELAELETELLKERTKRLDGLKKKNIEKIKQLDWIKEIPSFEYCERNEMLSYSSFVYLLAFNLPSKLDFIKETVSGFGYLELIKKESLYQGIALNHDIDTGYYIGTSNRRLLIEFIEKYNIKINNSTYIIEKNEFYSKLKNYMK